MAFKQSFLPSTVNVQKLTTAYPLRPLQNRSIRKPPRRSLGFAEPETNEDEGDTGSDHDTGAESTRETFSIPCHTISLLRAETRYLSPEVYVKVSVYEKDEFVEDGTLALYGRGRW